MLLDQSRQKARPFNFLHNLMFSLYTDRFQLNKRFFSKGNTLHLNYGQKRSLKLIGKDYTGFIQKIATIFQGLFKDFSRTTLDFQGQPTRNIISQIVQKCIFPVYSNKTLRH